MKQSPERAKIIPLQDRQKRVAPQITDEPTDERKFLIEKKAALLAEVQKYEAQNFDDWPDGKSYLEAARKELYKIDNQLDRLLQKK